MGRGIDMRGKALTISWDFENVTRGDYNATAGSVN